MHRMMVTLNRGDETLLEMSGAGRDQSCWVSDLKGWTGSPSARVDGRKSRPSLGSLPLPTTFEGRVLTLTGWADCRTAFETQVLAEQIANTFRYDPRGQSDPIIMYVQHHGVNRWAEVELDGEITAIPDCVRCQVDISIPLYAPDPLKYGLPVVSRGSWGAGSSGGLEYPLYAPGVTTRESRRNLMIYPRTTASRAVAAVTPSASANWGGVVLSRSQVADSSAPSGGGYVTRWTAPSAGTIANAVSVGWVNVTPAAAPGDVYTASIYVRPSVDMSICASLRFSKNTPPAVGNLKQIDGSGRLLSAGQWGRLSVSGTAPATTTNMQVLFYATATTNFSAGTTLDLDACLIEQSDVLGDYLDGAKAAADGKRYGWEGAPDASESVEYGTVRSGNYKGGYLYYSGVQTGHRVEVPNAGLEPTWPILRVSGATSWVRFSRGNQVVQLNAQTEDLTIDCRTGECTSEGVDVSGYLTRDDFFQIPAGGATVSFQASNPVDFEVEASPSWL